MEQSRHNGRVKYRTRRRALSSEETQRIRDASALSKPEIKMSILLALNAGLRLSEVCGLNIDNVRTAGVVNTSVEVTRHNAKYGRARTVPLDPTLREALDQYIRLHRRAPQYTPGAEPLLVCSRTQERLTPRTIQRHYKYLLNRLGIQGTTFHSLRHTFAERLRKVTDLPTLQMLMGHRHLSSTQVYMHPGADDAALAIASAWRNQ